MGLLSSLMGIRASSKVEFSLNDPAALDYLGGGGPSVSGIRVNRHTAMQDSAWYRGINLLAGDVGKLPLFVYRRGRSGTRERDRRHQAYRVLRREANERQTAGSFRETLTSHAVATGDGYGYIDRDLAARPLRLIPLDPGCTWPVLEKEAGLSRLWYVTQVESEHRKIRAEDILHIRGLSDDGLCGVGAVDKARDALGLNIAARRSQAIFYKNAGRPAVVLETPHKMEAKARGELADSWGRMHSGLENAHKTAVLDRGLTAKVLSLSAEQSQTKETRLLGIADIANFIGVPPHKLGHTEAGRSYASLEQENLSYLEESLDTWLVRWEEECWRKLLTDAEMEGETHFIEFLRQALVRADLNTRGAYYGKALGGAPWMTRNEVRALENLNPVDGGDELMDPLNMGGQQGEQQGEGVEPDREEDEREASRRESLRSALVENLEEAAGRMVRRICLQARKHSVEGKRYIEWLDSVREEQAEIVRAAISPPVRAVIAFLPGEGVTAEGVAADLLEQVWHPLNTLADTCAAAGLAAEVESVCLDLEANLPGRLARELMED